MKIPYLKLIASFSMTFYNDALINIFANFRTNLRTLKSIHSSGDANGLNVFPLKLLSIWKTKYHYAKVVSHLFILMGISQFLNLKAFNHCEISW